MLQIENQEIESALIGCLLKQATLLNKFSWLTPNHFYTLPYRTAFAAIQERVLRGESPDLLTIAAQLPDMKVTLIECLAGVITTANAPDYAEQVKTLYCNRQLAEIARKIQMGDIKPDEARDLIEKATEATAKPLTPTPLDIPESLPKREFVYGTHLIRRFTSMTVAAAGTGKSTIAITDALAIATGKPLLGHHIHTPCNVWIYNLEDPLEEMQRRVWASCLKHDISFNAIKGKIFIDSGRDRGLTIVSKGSIEYTSPDKLALVNAIKKNNIGVLIVDPFVSSYEGNENDNKDVDKAIKTFNQVADATNCSIELIHHTGKTGGESGNANAGRGASSMVGAVRSLRTIVSMTEEEAANYDIANPRAYVRIDDGKTSLAAYNHNTDWYAIESLELPNGDNVGVVARWTAPTLFDGISVEKIRLCVDVINTGRQDGRLYHMARSGKSKDAWVGFAIAESLQVSDDKAASIVKKWLKNGVLYEAEYIFDYKPWKGVKAKFSAY
jgi:hypothetical protein